MTIFVDLNHGHDKVTGKSITDLIGLLGSTPINWYAKWQSAVMTLTFGAEFTSLKRAAEEAIVYWYFFRSFGMRVTKPTIIYEDNISVVLSSSNPDSTLQHKSMALSYYFAREHVSGEVAEIQKVHVSQNIADALTKGLDSSGFRNYSMPIIHN